MEKLKVINGFLSGQDSPHYDEFRKLYNSLRKKEGRKCSDQEVRDLPRVQPSDPHGNEWKIRRKSSRQLMKYLKGRTSICTILEVGCGNGWLSALMAETVPGEVTGMDINQTELNQARRIFRERKNLNFIKGDIRSGILGEKKFDLIVFAASLQYFQSLKDIMNTALFYLTLQGEIHILDTCFYRQQEIPDAIRRSKKYFEDITYPKMADFYFHHSFQALGSFNYRIRYNPSLWINRILMRNNPFPWIIIKNHYT